MSDNLLFWGTFQDKDYLPYLKGCTSGYTVFLRLDKITTITEVVLYCKKKNIKGVISTSIPLLKKLLNWTSKKAPSLAQYSGSIFIHEDIEILFVNPIKHCITVSYGKFLLTRYVSKLTRRDKWLPEISFNWSICKPETFTNDFDMLSNAFLIAIDIETFKEEAKIRCVCFAGFFYEGNNIVNHTVVLPVDSIYNLSLLRKLCWELKAPKVLQNGKYDMAYLTRYNSPVYNWLFDTATMFHSWYSELPKDLANINAFCIRKAMYWKDMANTTDLHEYYKYNAIDGWATGSSLIAMLLELPQYAKNNYYLEFPTLFPCHLAEMIGIKRDMNTLAYARRMQEGIDMIYTDSLRKILGVSEFNPGSSKQCVQVLHLLGHKDLTSADEKNLKKAKFRHPFSGRIVDLILKAREARTLNSKYLQVGDKAKEFKGRILYSLNPHGTDTGRLASKEHHFWCGLQIQNIPRGKMVKQTLISDPGFFLAEVDLEQAESRDTAYISGEEKLIEAVSGVNDFHSINCSAFFGVPYEEIYDNVTGKTLNKSLRDLAKRVNHGANYNMAEYMLLETMGTEKVIEARNLLGLPKVWSLVEVAKYLLDQFHKTYPKIRGIMYKGIINEIATTKMLKSMAIPHPASDYIGDKKIVYNSLSDEGYNRALEITPTWTRYCFGDPNKSKTILNSYVAHPPQSLNAMTLNKAWLAVFNKIAINPEHSSNFKLIAQVHDSILFQYRIGHTYLCDMVKECMEIPVTIKAYDNKIRTFTVPAGIKRGINNKPAKYWSETE